MENINDSGSEYEPLLDAGIEIYSHSGISGQLHHKYAIVDHSQALSDPTVVTGSHNWSTTAETTNDENTLVIHNERIANLFYQEFMGLLNGMGVGIAEAATLETVCTVYPNPATDEVTVTVAVEAAGEWLRLRDASGRLVLEQQINASAVRLQVGHLPAGIYLAQYGESLPSRLVIR
jgi:phosphatidylserine/phosphatidylglycerophosphate/cardiolipin synthase-like enzyme